MGASCGMKTVAFAPSSRAAHATAWPWLPALAATTPARFSSSDSVAILLTAPRTLNAPVSCRFSAFSHTSRPHMCVSVPDPYTGVTRAIPSIRARASWISASVGTTVVAKLEHLFKYLVNSGQRVELTTLHLVQQPPQLWISFDGALQMQLRAAGSDGEHLACEILPPPLLEQSVGLKMRAVRFDLLPEQIDVLAVHCFGEHDRRPPSAPGRARG